MWYVDKRKTLGVSTIRRRKDTLLLLEEAFFGRQCRSKAVSKNPRFSGRNAGQFRSSSIGVVSRSAVSLPIHAGLDAEVIDGLPPSESPAVVSVAVQKSSVTQPGNRIILGYRSSRLRLLPSTSQACTVIDEPGLRRALGVTSLQPTAGTARGILDTA